MYNYVNIASCWCIVESLYADQAIIVGDRLYWVPVGKPLTASEGWMGMTRDVNTWSAVRFLDISLTILNDVIQLPKVIWNCW